MDDARRCTASGAAPNEQYQRAMFRQYFYRERPAVGVAAESSRRVQSGAALHIHVLLLFFLLLLTDALSDCLALHWYRVVEIQERVEKARPSALGDEVSRAVDMAVGSSFRGAFARFVLFFLPPNVSLTRPFASHRIASHHQKITAVSAILLSASVTHTHTLLLCFPRFF